MSFELPEVVKAKPICELGANEYFAIVPSDSNVAGDQIEEDEATVLFRSREIEAERTSREERERWLFDTIEKFKGIGFRQSQELALLRISDVNKE